MGTIFDKNTWSYQEVMTYFQCKKTKAYDLMKLAEEVYGGKTPYTGKSSNGRNKGWRVYADAVLAIDGTSREKEMRLRAR